MYNEEKIFNYLFKLSKSNIHKMFFSSYLEVEFYMTKDEANSFIGSWELSIQKPRCKNCD